MSTRHVFCVKLNKEAEGLTYQPYPGALGERIYQNISSEAWQNWLGEQTKLINEYRLNPLEPSARSFLESSMVAYLFNEQAADK